MSESYDVALSFAGEDRAFAAYLADAVQPEYSVFYDEFEKAKLWGADLSDALPARYVSSRYCVILLSDDYLAKVWTTLERQALVFEFLRRRGRDYLLPVRVRGCISNIPGVSGLVGYLRAESNSDWPTVRDALLAKLAS